MGSMLLGVIVSAVLYGISLLQCLFYFTRTPLICTMSNIFDLFIGYGRDAKILKILVMRYLFSLADH
jgi:hypothetical protein